MLFLPLRLHLASSSRPKMASLAKAVVRFLKLAMSEPGLLFITCSIGCNLGGVANGDGGMLFTGTQDWLPSEPVVSFPLPPLDVQPHISTPVDLDAP